MLVLLRNSSHNNNTWGLPGGNLDQEDGGDLMQTAVREAKEEMTTLPHYEVMGQVFCRMNF
jgi:ADP-ribose pyrophosphatase YjhB (NUDIX family)